MYNVQCINIYLRTCTVSPPLTAKCALSKFVRVGVVLFPLPRLEFLPTIRKHGVESRLWWNSPDAASPKSKLFLSLTPVLLGLLKHVSSFVPSWESWATVLVPATQKNS